MQGLDLRLKALQHVYAKLNLSWTHKFGMEKGVRGVKLRDEFIKAMKNFNNF